MDLLQRRRAMMTDVPEPTPPTIIELTLADFTASKKVWSNTAMELVTGNSYRSVPDIVEVKPGDLISWVDVPVTSNTSYIMAAYDQEGNPVVIRNNANRWAYSNISSNPNRTVPAGVYNVGFMWTRTSLQNWTEASKIVITKYP